MLDLETLKTAFGPLDFREKRLGVYKVLAPFFYEDGDMYDIFLEELGDGRLRLSDYGLTLMKLSYAFDLDSPRRQEVLENICAQSRVAFEDGMLFLDVHPSHFAPALSQFAQAITRVSNMEILGREQQASQFARHLREAVEGMLADFDVQENHTPTQDAHLTVDYMIPARRPIFLYGVSGDAKASRVLVSCLTFQREAIPFRSLIVHDNMDSLSRFNRAQLTNVAQKQFSSLDGFSRYGSSYIQEEMQA